MKKILYVFIMILCMAFTVPIAVSADDEVVVVEEEKDFENDLKSWLSQYVEESIAVRIVSWLVDAGVLSALFVVYLKYRKYKHTTIEDMVNKFKEDSGKWLKDSFDKLSKDEIDKLINAIDDLEKSTETIMKVLVLMQDNTAKGKVALLEYLGAKTDNKEVTEAVKEVEQTIDEQVKVVEEVKEKVAGEYEDIF